MLYRYEMYVECRFGKVFIRQELLEIHKVQDFAQLYSVFHLQGGYSATEQTRTLFE